MALVFEKIAFLIFGDRQTDNQTDGQARCMKSGGLLSYYKNE